MADDDDPRQEFDEDGFDEGDVPEEERFGWAAYLGCVAGLAAGLIGAILAAAGLHAASPGTRAAEVCWEVGSAVLGFVGLVVGGLLAHRFLRGQILIPAILCIAAIGLGVLVATVWVGFPWR